MTSIRRDWNPFNPVKAAEVSVGRNEASYHLTGNLVSDAMLAALGVESTVWRL
ncbi:MAG: hypothetical protein OXI96_09405 [Acidimicrobiaceae bacterium]|nr:hypothetical protein [Acidimicrobiaceae bacterium]